MEKIKYKRINKGKYKYELLKKYSCKTNLPENLIGVVVGYIRLKNNEITIYPTYQWDGASGPTWDDKTNMRGSLVHDALYQLMAEEKIDKKYRKNADDLLYKHLLADGMNPFRAKYYWIGVRAAGWIFI